MPVMRAIARIALLASLLIAPALSAHADDEPQKVIPQRCPICQTANSQASPYPQRAAVTLMRGMTNTTFGWTEMLTQPRAEVEHGGNLALGMGKGVGLAIKRTASGVGELFTFWVPRRADDQPIAEDCPICMLPTRPVPPAAKTASPSTSPPSSLKP